MHANASAAALEAAFANASAPAVKAAVEPAFATASCTGDPPGPGAPAAPARPSRSRRVPKSVANPLTGPASLIARGAGGPTCRHCGSGRVTLITMKLTDGSDVDFASCHTCERRTWLQSGAPLGFDSVLAKSRKIA